ncbi:MAG: NFYB/HAP3 family transcription factor subunit [Theionarchaea archaeon]|nr:NFYB/HAP3 family transcription factor subunit [Theionarchaea archaeon]MBU6999337.1 NFYB/HAP3 family transcription factor subunit [Theionarchaea archaeon]MBU7034127.1 NFYB/HAP3 family transcription factor subunit [Theionarchaea archaeon]
MALSSPPIERLIRKGGAERVSRRAATKLAEVLEEYGTELSRKAIEFAHQENRKTIRKEDIRKAIKELSW